MDLGHQELKSYFTHYNNWYELWGYSPPLTDRAVD